MLMYYLEKLLYIGAELSDGLIRIAMVFSFFGRNVCIVGIGP